MTTLVSSTYHYSIDHLVWFNSSTEETGDRALLDDILASVAFS